ncbi:MAG: sulfite exporter TauE/SafE family protein [Candidatus Baltobacteraceae bacterium]
MMLDVAMFAFGFCVGAVGTMVGVGGGFIIVPVIALLQPAWETRTVTAFSLAVVCANACSGTAAYLRQRRVDVRSALTFSVAAVPGVILGVFGANSLSRGWFDLIFGILLAFMAGWLALGKTRSLTRVSGRSANVETTSRKLEDSYGTRYSWSFDMRLGLVGSAVVGVVSALFGIGGGPLQVPFLVAVLNYPEHVATATSHAVLAVTSLVATLFHAFQGDYAEDLPLTLSTALGAISGAPIGARLSRYVRGDILIRILAAMLAFIAFRLIFGRLGENTHTSEHG